MSLETWMSLTGTEITDRLEAIFNGRRVCAVDRRYALEIQGITLKEISEHLGYRSHSVVSEVISNSPLRHRMEYARTVIAAWAGVPYDRFWNDG